MAVTGFTGADILGHKGLAVRAGGDQIAIGGVALAADVDHRTDIGRGRPVVAVAVITGRRRQVALFEKGNAVYAGAVFLHLVGGNLVLLHIFRVGVAATAGLGHIGGIDWGLRVINRQDAMCLVAVAIASHAAVALSKKETTVKAGAI